MDANLLQVFGGETMVASNGRLVDVEIKLSLALFLWCTSHASSVYFMKHSEKIVSGGDQLKAFTKSGMSNIMCAVFCHGHHNCDLYQYSTASNACAIFRQKMSFNPSVNTTLHSDWSLGYIQQHLWSGAWTLVFRAQQRIGVSVYETWMDSSHQNDRPLSPDFPKACLKFTDYSQCDRHFRSYILDNWSGISQVRYSLTKNDVEVAYIVFDGTGSNMLNWFIRARILHSTWSPTLDLDNNLLLMSIQGFCNVSCRRFHVHENFNYCRYNYFYTFVIDANFDNCNTGTLNWELNLINTNTFPVFIYAPGSGPASYGIDRGTMDTACEADVLSIWVKFA